MNRDEHSFNLTKNNRRSGDKAETNDFLGPFTWKEHAYERLKVLFGVSKTLSSMDNLENGFPKVLTLCSSTFPFLTATVIEKRGAELKTMIWNSKDADRKNIDQAIKKAKESFIFLTGSSADESSNLRNSNVNSEMLKDICNAKMSYTKKENFCVIPLVVDRLPAFGILQIEGVLGLTENDLEFVGALGDIISISLDRQHKSRFEFELRQKEVTENSAKLIRTATRVLNLEAERDLRERFVSLLTHDLRTPLSAIKMNSQLIEQNRHNAQAVQSYATRINVSVNRADQMISNLLDANLIRSGQKLPIFTEAFELISLIQKTLDELSVIHINPFILNASEPIKGFWDIRGIRRIIENLCNNAVKYGTRDTQITINVFEEAGNALIEICNKGEVISTQDQKFLFQQFSRGRKKTNVKGWGIGLTLVRGVAEAHGGRVKVKSEIETGTIFTVIIPLDSRPFIIQ